MVRQIVNREKLVPAKDEASEAVVRAVLVSTRLPEETLIALARKEPVDVVAGCSVRHRAVIPRKD